MSKKFGPKWRSQWDWYNLERWKFGISVERYYFTYYISINLGFGVWTIGKC